jgi:hypothetical protein
VTTTGFGVAENIAVTALAVYSNTLYAGVTNASNGAQIWRSSSGDSGDWSQVAPDVPGSAGTTNVTGFAVYNGAFYAAVEGSVPAQVWRSPNGSDWTPVVTDGFGDPDNTSTGGFAEFGGYLYVGAGNSVDGAQLWRTQNGSTWELAMGGGFGDLTNDKVEMAIVAEGNLYAGLKNPQGGLQIWRSPDAVAWTQVSPGGFGDSNNFASLWSNASLVFEDTLVVGTWNTASGGEIWRFLDHQLYLPATLRP